MVTGENSRQFGLLASPTSSMLAKEQIDGWKQYFSGFEFQSMGKWFLLSALIGVVAGVGGIVFQYLGQVVQFLTLATLAGFEPQDAAGEHVLFRETARDFVPWMVVVVMTAGGLFSGWLVYTFAPEAEGHGTDAAIDAFHNRLGRIRARIPFIKTIASAVTIGTGGSAGREGPIAQIGAGFGSCLASMLKLSARDRRIMLAAGMGAGVGAVFRAPLAGALFAGEIMYRDADLESDVIVPSAVASTIAYSVYCLALPVETRFQPLFGQELQYALGSPLELMPYALLAIIVTLVGALYIKTFYGTHRLFQAIPITPKLKPAVGAGLAGLVGIGLYYLFDRDMEVLAVLGTGYGTLQDALSPGSAPAIRLLLAVAFMKIVTTSLTISSGGSGGVFGPSMVIGGCLGTALGQLFHQWWPDLVPYPQTFGIVGMAGFFAGCARAPFSTILMVSEMTGTYQLLLPTLWVCTIAFLLGHRWTLYQKQVPTRLDSPAHRGDFMVDVLEGIRVGDVVEPDPHLIQVNEAMSLDDIVHTLDKTNQRYFPVLDSQKQLVGIFSADDVRRYLYDDTLWQLANARDIMTQEVVTITPEGDLNTALSHFTALNIDELPVVSATNPDRVIGMLRHKELIAAYNRRLMEHKKLVAE